MLAKTLLTLLILNTFFNQCIQASGQLSKLYVDNNPIHAISSLKTGFSITIKDTFLDSHLFKLGSGVTIFVSALPLNCTTSSNEVALATFPAPVLGTKKPLEISSLQQNTWYILCVEHETSHYGSNNLNTSTTCGLHRTRNKHGMLTDAPVSKVAISESGSNFVEFTLTVEPQALGRLTLFLELGHRPAQVFILTEASDLLVRFGGLKPGRQYGRICSRYEPLLSTYTPLGRAIHAGHADCYLGPIELEDEHDNLYTLEEKYIKNTRKGRTVTNHSAVNYQSSLWCIAFFNLRLVMWLLNS